MKISTWTSSILGCQPRLNLVRCFSTVKNSICFPRGFKAPEKRKWKTVKFYWGDLDTNTFANIDFIEIWPWNIVNFIGLAQENYWFFQSQVPLDLSKKRGSKRPLQVKSICIWQFDSYSFQVNCCWESQASDEYRLPKRMKSFGRKTEFWRLQKCLKSNHWP